jgi:GH25 family lysozyme M1 (1,4-beta-N-acetylmuramidase)
MKATTPLTKTLEGSANSTESDPRRFRLRVPRPSVAAATTAVATALLGLAAAPAYAATTPGVDVSHHQGAISWANARNAGIQFGPITGTPMVLLPGRSGTALMQRPNLTALAAHHPVPWSAAG